MPRKQKKYHYIYKTTNNVNGKYYYGMHSTDDLNDGYIGSGTRLWHSINYHGKENHSIEILEYLDDRESLRNREKELITEEMLKDPMCMNLVIGGSGGLPFVNDPDKRKEFHAAGGRKVRRIQNQRMCDKIKNNPEFKKTWQENISNALTGKMKGSFNPMYGKKHSDETKRRIGEANSKSRNPSYGTCWIHKDGTNKKIKKEELETFILNGWNKGRKMK